MLQSTFTFQLASQMARGNKVILFSLRLNRTQGNMLRKSIAEHISQTPSRLDIRCQLESLDEIGRAAKDADVLIIDSMEALVINSRARPHPSSVLRRIAVATNTLVIVSTNLNSAYKTKVPRYHDRADKASRFDYAVIPYLSTDVDEVVRSRYRLVCENRKANRVSFDGALDLLPKGQVFCDVEGSVGDGELWFAASLSPYQNWRKTKPASCKNYRREGQNTGCPSSKKAVMPFLKSRKTGEKRVVTKMLKGLLGSRETIRIPKGYEDCVYEWLNLLKYDFPVELMRVTVQAIGTRREDDKVIVVPNYVLE